MSVHHIVNERTMPNTIPGPLFKSRRNAIGTTIRHVHWHPHGGLLAAVVLTVVSRPHISPSQWQR